MKSLTMLRMAFSALMCALSLNGWADTSKPSVESFFKDPEIRMASISPSGKHIAWVQKNEKGHYGLIAADTDNLLHQTIAASFTNVDVFWMDWVNEDRLVMQVVDLHNDSHRSNGDQYAVNRDGSQLRQLTTMDWSYQQEQTGSNIKLKVLPAEYEVYGVTHDGSDDVIVSHTTYDHIDYSAKNVRLFRLNTRSLKLTDLLAGAQRENVVDWVLDRNDKPRVAVTSERGQSIINAIDPQTGEWVEIGKFDNLANSGFWPRFMGADDKFYVSAGYHQTSALYRFDIKQKKLADEPMLTIDGFDYSGHSIYDYQQNKLLGIHYDNDATGTAWLVPEMKALQDKIDSALPNTINTLACGNCLSAPAVLVEAKSDRQPTQYLVYHIAKGALTLIGGERPDIQSKDMGSRDFTHYQARDGRSIPIYITTPPDEGKGPRPTVVLVHGGPYVRGGSWAWDGEAQFLASRGYLVLQPEFRGSMGFGFDHFHAGWQQWGLTMQDDLADAAQWAIAKGMADPKRIAIAGASYGGYATLMGLIKDPALFKCGFEWVGVSDIDLMFTVAESDASLDYLHYDAKVLIGDRNKDAERFRLTSPLENAAKLTQPLLMAYGGVDRRVPIVHGTAFRDAVSKTNPHVEWIEYPEEGHGWFYERDRIDFWKHVETFLDKNLPVS